MEDIGHGPGRGPRAPRCGRCRRRRGHRPHTRRSRRPAAAPSGGRRWRVQGNADVMEMSCSYAFAQIHHSSVVQTSKKMYVQLNAITCSVVHNSKEGYMNGCRSRDWSHLRQDRPGLRRGLSRMLRPAAPSGGVAPHARASRGPWASRTRCATPSNPTGAVGRSQAATCRR